MDHFIKPLGWNTMSEMEQQKIREELQKCKVVFEMDHETHTTVFGIPEDEVVSDLEGIEYIEIEGGVRYIITNRRTAYQFLLDMDLKDINECYEGYPE